MERLMPSLKELQARIKKADKLLAKRLPLEERLRIEKLRYLDLANARLRARFPELDKEDRRPARKGKRTHGIA
jgi:hypothetical protein